MKRIDKNYFLAPALVIAAALSMLAWCYFYEYTTLHTLGGTLDDTYIHLRFAWNLAHSHEFSFNPGHPLPGSTSPLWVVLLAPFAFWSKQFLADASLALSSLSFAGAGVMTWMLGKKIGLKPPFSLGAGLMVATNGRLLWAGMSGMETDLFALLSLAGAIVYLSEIGKGRITWRTGIVFGLASLARPEGHMLFAGIVCHYLIFALYRRDSQGAGRIVRNVASALLAYLVLVTPYMVFSMATIGHPLPTTYLAKHAEFAQFREKYVKYSILYFWLDNPVASIFFVAAFGLTAYRLWRERIEYLVSAKALVAGWGLGYLAVSAWVTPMPQHFCRYQIPVLPFLLLMCMQPAQAVSDWVSRRRRKADSGEQAVSNWPAPRWIAPALVLVLVAPQLYTVTRWPRITTLCAKNILEMHVTIGKWLERATPESSTIATMDVGAIGFYSDRRIIDLFGLMTPEVVPYIKNLGMTRRRSESLLKYLREEKPDYVAIFPTAFPGLVDDKRVFTPLYQVVLKDNQIAMADWMLVCQCNWDKASQGP